MFPSTRGLGYGLIIINVIAIASPCSSQPAEPRLVGKVTCRPVTKYADPAHIAVSGDGKFIASGGYAGNYLWEVASGKIEHELLGLGGAAYVEFTTDNKYLITAYGKKVIIWNLKTKKEYTVIENIASHVSCIGHCSRYLAVATEDLSVELFEIDPFKKVTVFKQNKELQPTDTTVEFLRFDEKGHRLIIAFEHRDKQASQEILSVIDTATKKEVTRIIENPNKMSQWFMPSLVDVAISHDGKKIAAIGCHGHVMVWDTSNGKLIGEFGQTLSLPSKTTPIRFRNVTFSPDDNHITAVSFWGVLWTWDVKMAKVIHKSESMIGGFSRPVYSSGGRFVSAQTGNGEVSIWDLTHKQP